MTCELRKLRMEDLLSLRAEKMNENEHYWMDNEAMKSMVAQDFSMSIFYKGVLMCAGGVTPYWYNRAQIWTLFSEKSKANFLPVYRAIKRFIAYQPFKRVELCVPTHFALGKRRAVLLGFRLECEYAENFLPNGEDCSLFSYVRAE